ncbi:MAG: Multidrug resistance protein MdtA precursor [Bacteroidetes bacterium ADurb.BinA261]|jgi:membrane fusion protein (multidrug efflux system)|nr:MAG: Multidrug resistance protein MdtA precursor [Bacteroidetes bacterium ADurb.BinA261]
MSKKTRIIIFVSIGLLILIMALFPTVKKKVKADDTVSPRETGMSGGRQPLVVTATILQPQTLNDMFRMKGIMLPDEEVDLTFETSGKITKIYFQEGTFVKKRDLLAKVNDAPLQAELKKLEAQLPLAQDRVYRQQILLEKDAVSQETYQSVLTELETLKADIELTKARIAQTELRAPFDGAIGLRLVSEGAYASPTVVIAKLTKISPLKIEFSVNENMVNEIKPGTNLAFTVDNDLATYHATVYAIESRLDVQTLTFFARALFQNPGGKIKPGQSANVVIQLDQKNDAIVIPSISMIREMGRQLVYIYKNGKAKEVEIKTGLSTASSVQVTDGLSIGDTLLTTGVMQLTDGALVKIGEFVPNKTE